MSDAVSIKEVYDELKALRKDVAFIKDNMEDLFMTPEECRQFEQSMNELKEGKTTSLAALKKQLGA